jgi:hypothetical protein
LNEFWIILENSKMETGLPVSGLRCPLAHAHIRVTWVAACVPSHRCHCGRSPSGLEGTNSRYRLNSVELLHPAPVPVPIHAEREISCARLHSTPLLYSRHRLPPRSLPVSHSPEPSGGRREHHSHSSPFEQGPVTRSTSIARILGCVCRRDIATSEDLYRALYHLSSKC